MSPAAFDEWSAAMVYANARARVPKRRQRVERLTGWLIGKWAVVDEVDA